MAAEPGKAWHVPVRALDVPEAGARFDLAAGEDVRAAVARAADLVALPRLEAAFEVTHAAGGRLAVAGKVSATVVQTCVVSLEPMTSEIREPVDLRFLPAGSPRAAAPSAAGEERNLADVEEVDELVNGTVDLGAIAAEFLMLGLDPYPRRPDAVFTPPAADKADEHPFAALAALKERSGPRS